MKHILIVSRGGENRGDEAAMSAMFACFEQALGDVRFTLLYPSRLRSLRTQFRQRVAALPIVPPPVDYIRAAIFSLAHVSKLELRAILSPTMRQIVEAYGAADLVISTQGSSRSRDLDGYGELVHWWYIWLAHRLGKPLFSYATSVGPFASGLFSPVYRRLYRLFDVIVTREDMSQRNLRRLLGKDAPVQVTADSAIQKDVPPASRSRYFPQERSNLAGKFLVAISLDDHEYEGETRPHALRVQYDSAMIALIHHLHRQRDCHFIMLPQGHGELHGDAPFLHSIGQRLQRDVSWEMADPELDSDAHRAVFGMCDFHIASSYYAAIFGHMGLTPGICIYDEHESLGFMAQLGLERYAFDIRRPAAMAMCAAADDILRDYDGIVRHLEQRVPELQKRARRTTELAVELLRRRERSGEIEHRSRRIADRLEAKATGPL